MKKILVGGLSAIIFVFALSISTAFAVGSNGSFEIGTDPGMYTTLIPGNINITDWTVDSGSVDYIGTYWNASDGSRSIDMNGLEAGSISQTFSTVVGATYDVTFDLSGNPDSRADQNDPYWSPSNKVVSVGATGASSQNFSFDTSVKGNSLSNMMWENDAYSFIATGTSTTLTFASQIPGAFGPALDNVLITETLPVVSASCPEGTTQSSSPLETVSVNSNLIGGASSANNLSSGQNYLFVSTGTWINTGKNVADPEYASVDNWVTHMDGYDISPYFLGAGEFDLQINSSFVDWGSYGSSHSYSYLYPGMGTAANFRVFDGDSNSGIAEPGWYGDNSGSLNVDIYSCDPNTPPPASSTIHIFKYINGVQATTENASGVNFPMYTSTYSAPFTLGPSGWTSGDIAYEASTSSMSIGSSYSANENLNTSLVGSSCDGVHQYSLVGYGVGDTLLAAQQATPNLEIPNFTNLQGDKYIIVRNTLCPPIQTIKVHILKYLDGAKADSVSANGYQFPMTATWQASNLNSGASASGNYVLGNNHGGAIDQYGADTSPMNVPADYTTSEITDSSSQVVSSLDQCAPGKYLLNGYRTSTVSFADAAGSSLLAVAPIFTGLTADQYVIVDNSKCPTTGTITGMKYNDLNRNGKLDPNEPGLQGWTIRLILDNDTNEDLETVVTTAETDKDGNYTFSNVAPGVYEVREIHKKGWKRTSKNPKDIVISAGSIVTGVNFGNAVKQKKEKEDTDKDDDRDEQSGHYHGNGGESNYENEQGKKNHEQENDSHNENNRDDRDKSER